MQHQLDARGRYLLAAAGLAAHQIARLSCVYAQAPPEQKEFLLAELDFQRWYLDACRAGLRRPRR